MLLDDAYRNPSHSVPRRIRGASRASLDTGEQARGGPRARAAAAPRGFEALTSVERFDRRGTEPNELFRSEFGENSFKIQEFSLEFFSEFRQYFRKCCFLNFLAKIPDRTPI